MDRSQQVVILVKTHNFSYCGWCSTLIDVFNCPSPNLRCLPFETKCNDSCYGRFLVTDSAKDFYTIFQIMSFDDIIKLTEIILLLTCAF